VWKKLHETNADNDGDDVGWRMILDNMVVMILVSDEYDDELPESERPRLVQSSSL
jgi:hypothetical protein